MGLVNKADLQKILKTVANFDQGASPYTALQLTQELPNLFRSSQTGVVRSRRYNESLGSTYAFLSNFREILSVLKDDLVDLSLDKNGTLTVNSSDTVYSSEIRVHTVPKNNTGLKIHDTGDVVMELNPAVFDGTDFRPFSGVPVLDKGLLIIPTIDGVVGWLTHPDLSSISLYPRESFLKLLSYSSNLESVFLTKKGYWGASDQNLTTHISGHQFGTDLMKVFNVSGTKVGELPAERLVLALTQASSLCEKRRIDVSPDKGVTSKDSLGNPCKFSLGSHTGWSAFSISDGTANCLVSALKQGDGDVVELYTMSTPNMLRMRRGSWRVDFRTF